MVNRFGWARCPNMMDNHSYVAQCIVLLFFLLFLAFCFSAVWTSVQDRLTNSLFEMLLDLGVGFTICSS